MASPTKKTRKNRKRKEANRGKKRKAEAKSNGTTQSYAELFGDK